MNVLCIPAAYIRFAPENGKMAVGKGGEHFFSLIFRYERIYIQSGHQVLAQTGKYG